MQIKKQLIILLSLILISFKSYTQVIPEGVDTLVRSKETNDAIRFADGFVHTVSSPIRWKGKDWLRVGEVFGGTALITLVDKPVRHFWQDRDSKFWDGVERAGFHYGKPYAAFILTGGFYLTGLVIKNEWAKETGLVLATAYLTSGLVQTLMKNIPGRARPGTNVGPYAFEPFSSSPAYHSFPSGHIQVALISAMVLAERVDSPVLKAAFYSTAGLTLASRLYSDNHWFSDMAFGGAISWFCTKAVIKRMEMNKHQNPLKMKDKIVWNITPSMQGVTITGRF